MAAALDAAEGKEAKKELKAQRQRADEAWTRAAVEAEAVVYFTRHLEWLRHRFPEGCYRDVPGLCKVVIRTEIAAADWSLTPGRSVGVAAVEVDEDYDFEQTMTPRAKIRRPSETTEFAAPHLVTPEGYWQRSGGLRQVGAFDNHPACDFS